MDNRTIGNTYLEFKEESYGTKLVSISSILEAGHPIDSESGEDLELVSDACLDENGDPV